FRVQRVRDVVHAEHERRATASVLEQRRLRTQIVHGERRQYVTDGARAGDDILLLAVVPQRISERKAVPGRPPRGVEYELPRIRVADGTIRIRYVLRLNAREVRGEIEHVERARTR